MAARIFYLLYLLSTITPPIVRCLPEVGVKVLSFDENQEYGIFPKTMNKGTTIAMKGHCQHFTGNISIDWCLKIAQCADNFSPLEENQYEGYFDFHPSFELRGTYKGPCSQSFHLKDETDQEGYRANVTKQDSGKNENNNSNDGEKDGKNKKTKPDDTKIKGNETQQTKRRKRDAHRKKYLIREKGELPEREVPHNDDNDEKEAKVKSTEKTKESREKEAKVKSTEKTKESREKEAKVKSTEKTKESKVDNQVCAARFDGVYLLMVKAFPIEEPDLNQDSKEGNEGSNENDKKFALSLTVEMKDKHGYLSASDWPLYPFYGFMSLLYVFYGVVWLIVSACQWRDLLRIQFWIGGVIALGMLEKAIFFSEYNDINITGKINASLSIFAELVSCVKRTLARILVIIVSTGFGIVKPRLGNALHRVLGVGALYFLLATVEGCFRALRPKTDPSRQQLIASIPLAVLDAAICWWIFMSLVQTTRTLRIRRNLVKLSLYRHFTNTLIFAVLASVAYMIWSIKTHRLAKDGCVTDWSELWLDEAFWHFLFSIVLLVIMVLWRPTANNQRYAFTPLVDFGDDEDDDNMTLSDAFDGMKMRNVKNTPEVIINGDMKRKNKAEDDLKWVEENIPSSAADAVLPSVLDSDEELMTTKFEMSKME